jgi:hypothetical protein
MGSLEGFLSGNPCFTAGNHQLIAEGIMKSSLKLTAGFVCVILTALCQAGSLTPPDPPTAGTMKPLDQVEPRTPITSVPYTISTSGSYYLTKNMTSTGTGITIDADDVTIDLCGFTLTGPGFSYGVYMNGRSNVEIRNGTVRNFHYGITENSSSGKNHRILGVRSMSCDARGISLSGSNHQVRDCTVSDIGVSASNSYIYGIVTGAGGMVANCSVTNIGNNATATSSIYCIHTGSGSRTANNTVYNNGIAAAGTVFGINGNNATTITGNVVYANGTSVTIGNVTGINAGYGCTVNDNTVYDNGDSVTIGTVYGISGSTGCTISGNNAYSNGTSSAGPTVYGILTGTGSSVVGNTARVNGAPASGIVYGIYLASYSLANNNAAYGNTGTGGGANMFVGAGSVLGTNVYP